MFLSLEYRYAFVHIPKTAGKWLYDMLASCAWKDRTLCIQFWGQDHSKGIDATHLHQQILYDYVSPKLYQECVSFCVVRNPYNRFYSAFGDLPKKVAYSKTVVHRQNRPHQKAETLWVHKYPAYHAPQPHDSTKTAQQLFHQFGNIVRDHCVTTDTVTKHNIHLIPQHEFVYAQNPHTNTLERNVTHVLRFEHMGSDLRRLFDQYGFPHSARLRPHYPGSRMIRFDSADVRRNQLSYMDKYTPASVALVNRLYAKDFELFGFEQIDPSQLEQVHRSIGQPSMSSAHAPVFRNHQGRHPLTQQKTQQQGQHGRQQPHPQHTTTTRKNRHRSTAASSPHSHRQSLSKRKTNNHQQQQQQQRPRQRRARRRTTTKPPSQPNP